MRHRTLPLARCAMTAIALPVRTHAIEAVPESSIDQPNIAPKSGTAIRPPPPPSKPRTAPSSIPAGIAIYRSGMGASCQIWTGCRRCRDVCGKAPRAAALLSSSLTVFIPATMAVLLPYDEATGYRRCIRRDDRSCKGLGSGKGLYKSTNKALCRANYTGIRRSSVAGVVVS